MPPKKVSVNNRYLIVFAMSLAMLLVTFELTAINVALPQLAAYFHVRLAYLSWVPTLYLMGWMIFILPAGRLADHFGKKKIFILGLIIFAIGCLVAGVATNYEVMLLGRFLQGIGIAAVAPQTVAISREVFPAKEQGVPVGYIFLGAALGMSLGPFLGGLIVEFAGWRTLFLVFLPFGAIVVGVTLWLVGKDKVAKNRKPYYFDWRAFCLLAIASISLLLFSSFGTLYGWGSWWVYLLILVTILACYLLYKVERKLESPMIHFDVFKNRSFLIGIICRVCSNTSVSIALMAFPIFLQNFHHDSPLKAGLWLIPMSIGFGFGGVIVGQLSKRVGNPNLVFVSAIFMGVGFALALGLTNHFMVWYYILLALLIGFGGGGLISSITTLALHKLKKSVAGFSTSLLFLFVSLGNMVGFAITAVIIASRGQNQLTGYLSSHSIILNTHQLQGLINTFSGASSLDKLPSADQNLPSSLTHGVVSAFMSGFHWAMSVGVILSLVIIFFVIVFIIRKDRKRLK